MCPAAAVCALSGKAVSVLRRKGIPSSKTIHSLIYRPIEVKGGIGVEFERKEPEELSHIPLIIVDEASMVSKPLMEDLMSFEIPILWVGDHGQLEPIGENANLMTDPRLKLEKVHRQALESPIIEFATALRTSNRFGRRVEEKPAGWVKLPKGPTTKQIVQSAAEGRVDQIICGYNDTRHFLNLSVRKALGRGELPEKGDKVICLRNNREHGTFNGLMGTILHVKENRGVTIECVVDCGDGLILPGIRMLLEQFGQTFKSYKKVDPEIGLWDYGYAITCHKAQGSEWPRVLVLEELAMGWNPARWSYTAATRASTGLVYITNREVV